MYYAGLGFNRLTPPNTVAVNRGTFAGESLAQTIALRQASYVNRALALYGQLTGKAPPPVKQ